MNLIFTTIVITFYTSLMYMDCLEPRDFDSVEKLLAANNKSLKDFDHQLPTNYASVYKLQSGNIILIPAVSDHKSVACLVFQNQKCLEDCLKKDFFPIENINKAVYEYDMEGQRNIHKNIGKYQEYLNERLELNHSTLDRNNVQEYYDGVQKAKNKNQQDFLALGAVMGELQRKELNGRWVLEKSYGTFNPYYQPLIVYSIDDKIIYPYVKLSGMLKWKEKDARKFFSILPTPGPTLTMQQPGKIIELP